MIWFLLLSCIIETTPEQRLKYEAVCIREVVGANAPAVMLKVHEMRINACIVAKAKKAA